jgi:hypothetical protein
MARKKAAMRPLFLTFRGSTMIADRLRRRELMPDCGHFQGARSDDRLCAVFAQLHNDHKATARDWLRTG